MVVAVPTRNGMLTYRNNRVVKRCGVKSQSPLGMECSPTWYSFCSTPSEKRRSPHSEWNAHLPLEFLITCESISCDAIIVTELSGFTKQQFNNI